MYSRREWQQASEFHPHTDAETLEHVLGETRAAGSTALVILDLDETLYDAGPRNLAIFREWLDEATSRKFPEARAALEKLLADAARDEERRAGYSLEDQFAAAGVDPGSRPIAAAVSALRSFWMPRFFSNEYLRHDRPYAGAAEFAQALRETGASLTYLTGRNAPNMGEGTRGNLERDGFPLESTGAVKLILKARKDIDDHVYKRDAGREIAAEASAAGRRIVAHFENEPRNLVALARAFPDAAAVFVDTLCSEEPAEPIRGAYRIRGWAAAPRG